MKQALGGFIFGGLFFLWGFTLFRRSRATAAWPAIQGWIMQSTVTTQFSQGSEDSPDTYSYSPSVVYQYTVNGQTYQGTRITYVGQGYDSPAKAQAALAPYPAGQPVNVSFNPVKPHESVLVPGKTEGVLLMAVGVIAVAAGLAAASAN